ncbi:hypothetical protein [Streptomyces fragilis]|uniref:Uncharacterized protein n=1 Tax=Streptomyces fragilis TaxID=67301 RepID=A0ABV2YK65_9ACTN|nr:hypothetical protein [Streptomyces fragilis]
MRRFGTGRTVVRRDVHRSGRVRSEHALPVIEEDRSARPAAPERHEQ